MHRTNGQLEPQRPRCGSRANTAGSPWLQKIPRPIFALTTHHHSEHVILTEVKNPSAQPIAHIALDSALRSE
jgi:hypothetical protein